MNYYGNTHIDLFILIDYYQYTTNILNESEFLDNLEEMDSGACSVYIFNSTVLPV